MAINLNLLNTLVLEGVNESLVLSQTVRAEKDLIKSGKIGQSVDVVLDVLKDVSVKKYTEAMKAAQADYDFDVINLDTVPVVLQDETYAALEIDGWDNLVIDAQNVGDYSEIIRALVRKVVEDLESALATTITGITNHAVSVPAGTLSEQGEAVHATFVDVAYNQDDLGVEREFRTAAVGRNVAKRLVLNKDILNADKSADGGQALRKAIIGEVSDYNVVSSPRIPQNVAVFYHRDAFAIVSRPKGKMTTAPYSELATDENSVINLRVNVTSLGKRQADGIAVSSFFTAADLDSANRAYKVTFNFATA